MFKILDEVCTPTKGSKYSSCIDLYAREDVTIGAGETKVVPLGVKIDFEELEDIINQECFGGKMIKTPQEIVDKFLSSHCLELKCRSSLPLKKGLIIANGVGEIDLDYPDEIGILLHNPIKPKYQINEKTGFDLHSIWTHLCGMILPRFSDIQIKKGEKIAQIKLVEHKTYLMGVDTEEERKGGFGSTGN
jgi:dUTPase